MSRSLPELVQALREYDCRRCPACHRLKMEAADALEMLERNLDAAIGAAEYACPVEGDS